MDGYGGALKQLSIGFGSRLGKTLMHSGVKVETLKNFGKLYVQIKNLKNVWLIVLFLL